jgi:integrase/recombinase XerD
VEPTLPHLVSRYLAERRARGELARTSLLTIKYTLAGFVRVAGEATPPSKIRAGHVEEWLGHVPMAAATARARLSQVRSFCRWCVRKGYMPRDPTLEVKGPKPPRYVPRSLRLVQVEASLEAAPDRRATLMMLLMVQEGLRACEVAGLELGDIDPAERLMLIRGKGGHERVLPISDETWTAMEEYLAERPATAGPLVRSYNHPSRAITASWVSRLTSVWMHSAGVDDSGHSLRHTAATDMLRAGANIRDVQAVLGHASIATTGRYLGWSMVDLRKATAGRRYRKGSAAITDTGVSSA